MADHFLRTLANELSLLAIPYTTLPFVFFAVFKKWEMILWGMSVVLAPLLAQGIKQIGLRMDAGTWWKRPTGARDCDTWNSNGPQQGAPGFPSGHCATTAAFWFGAWWLSPTAYGTWVVTVGGLATLAMVWARMQKRCHTALQTIGGILLGVLVFWACIQLM